MPAGKGKSIVIAQPAKASNLPSFIEANPAIQFRDVVEVRIAELETKLDQELEALKEKHNAATTELTELEKQFTRAIKDAVDAEFTSKLQKVDEALSTIDIGKTASNATWAYNAQMDRDNYHVTVRIGSSEQYGSYFQRQAARPLSTTMKEFREKIVAKQDDLTKIEIAMNDVRSKLARLPKAARQLSAALIKKRLEADAGGMEALKVLQEVDLGSLGLKLLGQ